ncbi:decarboxylating dehydrogenases-isocitrate [Anaeramoeba flamelloides]|uniref:Decarboxylating dehydrogenases-isocitrate n=1 Tax=Anaeramoeba flamelloides TaxID=1746091 RepID=A0AAV7ZEI5_9EUKA|nr:decarboxylating dehydrogenases-isocitrate isopropylmalate tartrate [Anaeramoeba flamelloides]KAJ6255145.1 decarboxylating dehydrogenases-isocitrate [Anaeramoeba flamelloides]
MNNLLRRKVVLMPGDGIGGAVLKETVKVLRAVKFECDYVHADIGWEFWRTEGNPLPDRTLKSLRENKLSLFGAITSKPKWEAAEELVPRLKNKGLVYYSPIVGARQSLQLSECIRPCLSFEGNPLNFVRQKSGGGFEEPPINTVIFRQNTEGLYAGVEWTNPPRNVRQAFESHPKFGIFKDVKGEELAISTRIFTQERCNSICREAFEYAKKHGYKRVTIAEKPNVIRETSGMLEKTAYRIGKEYPDIWVDSNNIDAICMWLTKNPESYGVIIAGNMFGDIISDAFAGLVGGLGFACSANIGSEVAIFEPTHGSAPKYASYKTSIVNPIACILSGAMMLDHVGETHKADLIRKGIAKVIKEGKYRTYDLLKVKGQQNVIYNGAVSTEDMGSAIVEAIGDVEASAKYY